MDFSYKRDILVSNPKPYLHATQRNATQRNATQRTARRRPGLLVSLTGALSLMMIFGLSSCQKEEIANSQASPAPEVNVTPRVISFINLAERGSGSREGESLTVDSAVWYIEAALNLSYTNIAQKYTDQTEDSIIVTIPVVDGHVLVGEAGDMFLTLGQQINVANVEGTSHVSIVDVVPSVEGNSLRLSTVYLICSGYDRGTPNTNYGPNDHWWWMNIESDPQYCNCQDNTIWGACADRQIRNRVNYAINGGYYQYYTDVETWEVDHWGYDDPSNRVLGLLSHPSPVGPDNPINGDGIRDFPVYIGDPSNSCLGPVDMSFYTQGVWNLMQYVPANYLPNKVAASCKVQGDMSLGGHQVRLHWVTYRYGKLAKAH
ncbi:MAG: hypothetical protein J5I62_03315 [Flavobacteriales bacterium]|nr:hypothetical protein [Flavobacteriales bacterium]MEB2341131.1 hypothetical protein [Flavobacteriia bacterium]